MNNFIDIHTHKESGDKHALNNIIANQDYTINPTKYYSIGIHPWYLDTDAIIQEQIEKMVLEIKANPKIIAIGECGLDKLINLSLDNQQTLFDKQIELSETFQKPLIIHCVKYWQEIINIHKTIKPQMPWIIHGFRGKPQLAEDLLKNNIYLSVGEHFNKDSLQIIPTKKLFIETDESKLDIKNIYNKVANSLNIAIDYLQRQITENAQNIGLNALT